MLNCPPILCACSILASSVVLVAQSPLQVPSQFPDIGAAVQAAAPGAVIHVQPRALPYPPFVVDRPVTIVGSGQDNQAPLVAVGQGIGIDFVLVAGQRATLSRLDVAPAAGAQLTRGIVVRGGHVTLEDCRILGGQDATGSAGLAVVETTDADLTLMFTRIEGGRGMPALRATASRVAAVSTRCFGGMPPNADGVLLQDSTFHGAGAWLLGGEDFLGGAGSPALRALGTSRVWLVQSTVRGGMGSPGGSGLVNATSTPIELRNTVPVGGTSLNPTPPPPAVLGATVANPDLVSIRWNELPYRRGSLRPGQPWAVHVAARPSAPVLLVASFGPTTTTPLLTRQPAMLPADAVLGIGLLTDAAGNASHFGSVPNAPTLVGVGLWMQAVAGPSWPLEASPLSGAVVRPW